MGAGDSARFEAESLERAEARLRQKADYLASKAAAYRRGTEGEVELGVVLAALAEYGYYGFADLGVPGRDSNIDFVLVGPGGVFIIDSKCWAGELSVDGLVLRQNGTRRAKELEAVRLQAAHVAEVLDGAIEGRAVPIWPCLAFTGSATIGGYVALDRVHLIDLACVVERITAFPDLLSPSEVAHLQAVVNDRLAPRLAPGEHAGDTGEAYAPDEPVVFVTPWARYGKQRLYVRDELGIDGGHVDMKAGELVGTTPSAHAVLAQLLTHYASGGSAVEFSAEEAGLIRRLLDRLIGRRAPQELSLVVGYRWAKHGKERLYVHRLSPGGGKLDLGWVDLKVGRVHADVPGAEPVIRYCGQRYQATRPTT